MLNHQPKAEPMRLVHPLTLSLATFLWGLSLSQCAPVEADAYTAYGRKARSRAV